MSERGEQSVESHTVVVAQLAGFVPVNVETLWTLRPTDTTS